MEESQGSSRLPGKYSVNSPQPGRDNQTTHTFRRDFHWHIFRHSIFFASMPPARLEPLRKRYVASRQTKTNRFTYWAIRAPSLLFSCKVTLVPCRDSLQSSLSLLTDLSRKSMRVRHENSFSSFYSTLTSILRGPPIQNEATALKKYFLDKAHVSEVWWYAWCTITGAVRNR